MTPLLAFCAYLAVCVVAQEGGPEGYADRAVRFLDARRVVPPPSPVPASAAPPRSEESEKGERSAGTRVGSAPTACAFPRACGVLGPCERRAAGLPWEVQR